MTEKQLEQLNKKVAKGLGWIKFKYENVDFKNKNLLYLNGPRLIGLAPNNKRKQYVPHYTANLVYALKCVDWGIEHGYSFSLVKNTFDKIYHARFYTIVGIAENFWGEAFLPSMAIVKAFLKLREQR